MANRNASRLEVHWKANVLSYYHQSWLYVGVTVTTRENEWEKSNRILWRTYFGNTRRLTINFRGVNNAFYLLTCVGIHPGWVEPASPIEVTTSQMEALQARWSSARSLAAFIQSFLHRAKPKTRGPERGSRFALFVVSHVFNWSPVHLRHVRGGLTEVGPLSVQSEYLLIINNIIKRSLASPYTII